MTVTPEIRKDLAMAMARSTEIFLDQLVRGFFDNPDSSFARQVVIETTGQAVARIARRSPEGLAFLQTYCHELQDIINTITEAQQQ